MAYRKIEEYDEKTTGEIAAHIKSILELLGEDTAREGLLKTPERVAKAMQFLTQGYGQNGETIVKSAVFNEPYSQMVLVKDIELFSLCEHHMLPFIGKAHVAYIPNGRITGLSKVARVVETYARRRRLAEQIMDVLECKYDKQQVGMFLWGRIPDKYNNVEELTERLLHENRVFITPGFIFGTRGERYIRISLCAKEEKIEEALRRILRRK